MHRSTITEIPIPAAGTPVTLDDASFSESLRPSRSNGTEPPLNLAMMAVLLAGLTSCEGAPKISSFAFGGLHRESFLSTQELADPLDPFFPTAHSAATGRGYSNGHRQSGLSTRAQIHQWALSGFENEDSLHPNEDPLRLPSENETQFPPKVVDDPFRGLAPVQFVGNVVDTYRVSRFENETFQRAPRTEKVWDSVSDILNSPTALANIGAREIVRQIRKHGSGDDIVSNEVSDPLAGYMSPARWHPFGSESALHDLYVDARPRSLSSGFDECEIRFKVQWDLRGLLGQQRGRNYVGVAYDTDGVLVVCHAMTF